jgi:hypothetical protein
LKQIVHSASRLEKRKKNMDDLFSAVLPFLKEASELAEVLPQGHQNPPLEVVEGPSTFNDLRRLEVDHRLVIPANTNLRNIVTSVGIAHSVAPSSEGVTVLPQTGPPGGPSEAAETASTGQNRAVEQAGPSSRQWETKSPSNLNSSDLRSLARCFESLPEPGDEASSLPVAQEALPQAPAPAPHPAVPNPPVIPQFPPLLSDGERLVKLRETLLLYTPTDFGSFENKLTLAVPIEKSVEAALLEDGFNADRIRQQLSEIRGVLFCHPKRSFLLSFETLERYLNEIQTEGTRNSTPYRKVMQKISRYNIVLW